MASTTSAPASGGLWRHGDFLRLWVGQTISLTGTQIGGIALPLLAILVLQAGPVQVGVLRALGALPYFFFALPAGVWVDRLRRNPMLVSADAWRGILTVSIPAAALAGVLTMAQLYVVAFAVGVGTVIFEFAYSAYLPHLVSRDNLLDANSKLQISQSALNVGGPGLAGFLVQAVGASTAVLVDGLTYFVSAASLLLIRAREARPAPEARHLLTELREGFAFVRQQPFLRAQVTTTATFNAFISITFALQVLYMVRVLNFEPALIGIVFTLGAPGALLGSIVAPRLAGRFGIGPSMIGASLANGLAAWLVPAASGPGPAGVALLVAYGFIFGIAVQVYNINAITVRQAITPERMLGRMNGTTRFITWGIIPAASFAGGLLGQAIGLRPALWVAAVGASLAFIWLLLSPAPRWRTLADVSPAGSPPP